jgi:uncharacterized coiled-coil protein SlyX
MDKHFLEFWGNFLISVAQGQQRLEDMDRWLKGGFAKVQGLTDIFQNAYGLDQLNQSTPDYPEIWKKAEQDFKDSYRAYLNLMGLAPREDYAELAQRCEELKEKVAEQEETIKHLRLLLEDKGLDYRAVTQEFQELIKKQAETVQEFFSGVTGLSQKEGKNNNGQS